MSSKRIIWEIMDHHDRRRGTLGSAIGDRDLFETVHKVRQFGDGSGRGSLRDRDPFETVSNAFEIVPLKTNQEI